jgi:hypothetical protein
MDELTRGADGLHIVLSLTRSGLLPSKQVQAIIVDRLPQESYSRALLENQKMGSYHAKINEDVLVSSQQFRRSESLNPMPPTSAQADAARIRGIGRRWRTWLNCC